ncbi:MAG: type II secretion system F family protein [Acidimicrobiales bacterium]
MTALALAVVAAYGVHLVWTAMAMQWTGLGFGPTRTRRRSGHTSLKRWLVEAGLDEVGPAEFFGVSGALAVVSGAMAFAVFGSGVATLLAAGFAGSAPIVAYRNRRRTRRERASEAWPRIIEEIRILTASVGRSIPQALFEAGSRAPAELRPAFAAAQREWLMTTDFARTTRALKDLLSDPTADSACETLLVAYEAGGADLDRRLLALAEDRIAEVQGRHDARAQQAGVRFARKFVLIVPLGMALAGMSVGNGRSAYQEPTGQVAVTLGLAMVVGCWVWAGRIMRLPTSERVFDA